MGVILCYLQLYNWKVMELNELHEKGDSLLIGCKAKKNFREERVSASKGKLTSCFLQPS